MFEDKVSPAAEVHLVAPQVNVGVREHCADLLEQLAHEHIGGVEDGVDRSEGSGGAGPGVARSEQVPLTWGERREPSVPLTEDS